MEFSRELLEFFLGGLLLFVIIFQFKQSIKNRKSISLIDISIWITGTSFGLAPFILILYGGQLPEANLINVLLSYLGIFLFIIGLLAIKKNLKKSLLKKAVLIDIIKNVDRVNPKVVLFSYSIFFLVRAIFAFDYGIFTSGSATAERMQSLPYYLFVFRSLLDLVSWGCILWSIVKILSNKKLILLPAIILIIETLMIFFRGRRQMLYLVFLFIYIYILLGYRINLRILIPSTLILIILINFIFPAFITFREISLNIKNPDLIENYSTSYYSLLQTGIDRSRFESNIAQRVYINSWNIDIISKSSLVDGLKGQAIISSILFVIPRPLLPFKGLLKDPEYLINYNLGLGLNDSPSNWPAYGFADFGLLGGLIYGIFLGIILSFLQYFAAYNFNKFPFFSFTILGSVSFIAFFIEETPSAVFSVFRDIIIMYIMLTVLSLFLRKKVKSVNGSSKV